MKLKVTSFLSILLLAACTDTEVPKKEVEIAAYAQPKEHEETVNKGDYIKIVDEDTKKETSKPRLINAKALLNLGKIVFTLNDSSHVFTTFQKGYTDMHLSASGIKMRIQDMSHASFEIHLQTEDVFNKALQTYYPNEKTPLATLAYSNIINDEQKNYSWDSGSLKLTKFSTPTGKVKLQATGKLKNTAQPTELIPFELAIDMRFEQVTSSVLPN